MIAIALALLTAPLGGCIPVWYEATPAEALASGSDSLRVTTGDGERYALTAVRQRADSLVGFRFVKQTGWERVAVPDSAARKVERYDATARRLVGITIMVFFLGVSLAGG
jgi:hypothetical protein